jgi:hypothetical protein
LRARSVNLSNWSAMAGLLAPILATPELVLQRDLVRGVG